MGADETKVNAESVANGATITKPIQELTETEKLILAVIRRATLIDDAMKRGVKQESIDESLSLVRDAEAVVHSVRKRFIR